MVLEDSGGKDGGGKVGGGEWENSGDRNTKQEDYRRQEQGTDQGRRRYGSGRRWWRLGFDRSCLHGGPKIGGPWSCCEPSVP